MTVDPFYTWQMQIHPENKYFLEEEDIEEIFIDALVEKLQGQGNRKITHKRKDNNEKFKQLEIVDAIIIASQKT
ncbi:MAG: hypothetical protein ACFFCS_23605 [Candidatus Hodarchaeota archaeon]